MTRRCPPHVGDRAPAPVAVAAMTTRSGRPDSDVRCPGSDGTPSSRRGSPADPEPRRAPPPPEHDRTRSKQAAIFLVLQPFWCTYSHVGTVRSAILVQCCCHYWCTVQPFWFHHVWQCCDDLSPGLCCWWLGGASLILASNIFAEKYYPDTAANNRTDHHCMLVKSGLLKKGKIEIKL